MTSAAPSAWASRPRSVPWPRFPMPWPTLSVSAYRLCPSHPTASWPRLIAHHPKPREAAMRPFEYAAPKTADQVPALLGKSWGEVEILAGGSDLLSLMKDEITTPKRLVNIKQVAGLHA